MCLQIWLPVQVKGSNQNFFLRSEADLAPKGQIWPQISTVDESGHCFTWNLNLIEVNLNLIKEIECTGFILVAVSFLPSNCCSLQSHRTFFFSKVAFLSSTLFHLNPAIPFSILHQKNHRSFFCPNLLNRSIFLCAVDFPLSPAFPSRPPSSHPLLRSILTLPSLSVSTCSCKTNTNTKNKKFNVESIRCVLAPPRCSILYLAVVVDLHKHKAFHFSALVFFWASTWPSTLSFTPSCPSLAVTPLTDQPANKRIIKKLTVYALIVLILISFCIIVLDCIMCSLIASI